MYIVSSCLLGENVKYSGGNNYHQGVLDFLSFPSALKWQEICLFPGIPARGSETR